ncbi:hypothetical protein QQ045_002661 [Rhodiola kirilowii]
MRVEAWDGFGTNHKLRQFPSLIDWCPIFVVDLFPDLKSGYYLSEPKGMIDVSEPNLSKKIEAEEESQETVGWKECSLDKVVLLRWGEHIITNGHTCTKLSILPNQQVTDENLSAYGTAKSLDK